MDVSLYETLEEQVALVTGANRGIGAAVARGLADHGATVYAGARDPDAVSADDQRAVALDVTDREQVDGAVGTVEREAGRLDVLVNNAGVAGPTGPLADVDADAAAATLEVNLHGPMLLARRALPLLAERGGGRVVNVSSTSGQFAGGIDATHLPYSVSKAGLNALTEGLASQYPDLLVNAASPGWVRTEMGGDGAPRSVERGAETPVWLARFRPGSPSGRLWKDRRPLEW